jgi:tetratricopeptide (TPR) repeat protein
MGNSVYKKTGIRRQIGLATLCFAIFLTLPILAASEAVQWLSDAIYAYEHNDFGRAKISLEHALQVEPNFAEAYVLKGLLQYRDGQYEKAEASLKQALNLNPRLPDKMREQLEKRAHSIESHLTEQKFAHFQLQFHGAEQRQDAWQAVKHLEDAYTDLGSRFNYFPQKRFPVIIFTSQEFYSAWNAPFWLGGFYDRRDGTVRVRIETPPGGQDEARRRLRHEFTHAFIFDLCHSEVPAWFGEGVAQFYAFASPTNGFWKDVRLEELRKLMKGAPWMSLAEVESAIEKKNVSPEYIYLAYLESESLVIYIAKQRGDSWIPSVLQRVRNGEPFKQALEAVIGVPAEKMMDGVHNLLS